MTRRTAGIVEQHYTMKDVAGLTGLSLCTIQRMVGRGEFSRVRRLSRKAVRIPASSINAWLEKHTLGMP